MENLSKTEHSDFSKTHSTITKFQSSSASDSKERMLSLSDACLLAGVSSSTLMRFAEAGYFKIFNKDSEIKFSDLEISQVFGVTFNNSGIYSSINSNGYDSQKPDSQKPDSQKPDSQDTKLSAEKDGTNNFTQTEANPGISENNSNLNASGNTAEPSENSQYQTLQSRIEVINDSTTEADTQTLTSHDIPHQQVEYKEDFEPFKKVLQLQEELLAQKNTVIADLIKERDWLRSRLEKMEEKAERDQMLLMVESQKVRTLISNDKEQQKLADSNTGLLSKALAWFK